MVMDIRINIGGAVKWGEKEGSDNKTGTKTQTEYLLAVIL